MSSNNWQRACTFALDLISDTIVIILSLADERLQIEHVNLALEEQTGIQRNNIQNVGLSFIEESDEFTECAMECLNERHTVQPSIEFQVYLNTTLSQEVKSSISAVGKFHPFVENDTTYCVATLKIRSQDSTTQDYATSNISNAAELTSQAIADSFKLKSAISLEKTNNLLRKFVETLPSSRFSLVIVRVDDLDDPGGGEFVYVNRVEHLVEVWGCTTDKPIGSRAADCGIPPHVVLHFHKQFKKSKDSGLPVELDVSSQANNNRNEFFHCVIMHLGESYFGFMLFAALPRKLYQDLILSPNKEQLEENVKAKTRELQEALEIKSRFLAIVSHEIRTPLTGILGMLTLLAESNLDPTQADAVQIATTCCDQLMIVITDILDVTKAEYGNLSFDMNAFSVMNVVEESLDIVSFESEKKNLELVYDVDPAIPATFIGDKPRLRQVLVNLLNNAVKFSSKGQILLTVVGKPLLEYTWELLFSVADEGIGISEETKLKLFKPFQQADTSFTRSYGGSGLGLMISKRIVELMGGRIWFESQKGIGSTFYFTVAVTASQEKTKSYEVTSGLKVLLLEPNVPQPRILRSYLCSLGMIVVLSQGQNFNELTDNFDFVIMDGTLTKEIQQYKQLKAAIIVFGQKDPRIDEVEEKVFFVDKPIRYSKLYDCISFILGQQPSMQPIKQGKVLCSNTDMHILVAEDNLMNQKVIMKVLQSIGCCNIHIVSDGQEALETVKQRKFDVILMDCMMPVMDGYSSTKQIRAEIPQNEQPTIIALTANVSEENRSLCFSAGMNFVLTKPIQKTALIDTLNRIC